MAQHRTRSTKVESSSLANTPKSGQGTKVDNSWRVEISKKYTVAPAYNKGAYQVIPRSDVEHIGK
jgi:hypothetical protein